MAKTIPRRNSRVGLRIATPEKNQTEIGEVPARTTIKPKLREANR
jgi:hypothetical protein